MKKAILTIAISGLILQSYSQIRPDDNCIVNVSNATILQKIDFDGLDIGTEEDQTPTSEYRRLYFIHGLGGNGGSWSKVPDACTNPNLNIPNFPARKCYTSTPDYEFYTMGSLNYVASNMKDVIRMQNGSDYRDSGVDPSKAILIGHSQGGMVARNIIHNSLGEQSPTYGDDFGGFISIGSPLKGAAILNNRDLIVDMASNACAKLIEGVAVERWLVNGIFKLLLDDDYIQVGCEYATQNTLPFFFKKYYHTVTEDYKAGASFLDLMDRDKNNLKYKNLPKIAFYAVEPRDKIFWRTMEWIIGDPNGVDYFSANSDLSFYSNSILPLYHHFNNKLINARQRLERLEEMESSIIAGGLIGSLFGIPMGPEAIAAYYLRVNCTRNEIAAFEQSVNWFTEVNREWEVVIGTKTYESQTRVGYKCEYCCDYNRTEYYYDQTKAQVPPCLLFDIAFTQDLQECEDYYCKDITRVYSTTYNSVLWENDGVVTSQSASYLPNATWSPIRVYPREYENVIDKGSSHMQIRNDEGIKIHLNNALNGDYGDFFRTKCFNE
ncbi:GPI inositol-deacylase [Bacteroidales bacterium OttesenSCG-928-I21]|nr:GPI inositol-deacylase [Bacteroidales bacterium OttesenSCG-928-I21]